MILELQSKIELYTINWYEGLNIFLIIPALALVPSLPNLLFSSSSSSPSRYLPSSPKSPDPSFHCFFIFIVYGLHHPLLLLLLILLIQITSLYTVSAFFFSLALEFCMYPFVLQSCHPRFTVEIAQIQSCYADLGRIFWS